MRSSPRLVREYRKQLGGLILGQFPVGLHLQDFENFVFHGDSFGSDLSARWLAEVMRPASRSLRAVAAGDAAGSAGAPPPGLAGVVSGSLWLSESAWL